MPTRGRVETRIHSRLFNVSPNMNRALTVRKGENELGNESTAAASIHGKAGNLQTS